MHLKLLLRNALRHPFYTAVNVVGLAIGISACFLVYLYVHFERSYDGFHTKGNRIYRVSMDLHGPAGDGKTAYTPGPTGMYLQSEFSGVQAFCRVQPESILVTKGSVKFQEDNTLDADSTFFSVFSFPLLSGDPRTCLTRPYSVVLSQTAAKKYFGDADPVGQRVELTGWRQPGVVTGLMKDLPENSQFSADMVMSMSTLTQVWDTTTDSRWWAPNVYTYVLLAPGAETARRLQAALPDFMERHLGDIGKLHQERYAFRLEPLPSIYLHSDYGGAVVGNNVYVTIFSMIAVFFLLVAGINFVNLTTARAVERAREVGVLKVIGAQRGRLVRRFVLESVCLGLAAFVVSIALVQVFMPLFVQLVGKPVTTGRYSTLWLLLLSVGIGLVSGIYPALVLSSYRPVLVLKGRFSGSHRGRFLRKLLVVVQFTLSIGLIIGTVVVYAQLSFMRNQDLGFQTEQVLVVPSNGDPLSKRFKEDATGLPAVVSTSFSWSVPGDGINDWQLQVQNAQGEPQRVNLPVNAVDEHFIDLYGLKIVAGRKFSNAFADTTHAVILNEAAVRALGYRRTEDIIGKPFKVPGETEGQVVGVLRDYHLSSLQNPITPAALRMTHWLAGNISIQVRTRNMSATLHSLESLWDKLVPNRPFQYKFMDEYFDRQYRGETRFGRLFIYFSVLVILISCLGLLGLSSYNTLQRTREIGIRKVLGSSVSGIVVLLSREFVQLIGIAWIIAAATGGWLMYHWLQAFAYRVAVSWWMIAVAGAATLLVALATVAFQSIRAALEPPVKSLRAD